MRSVNALPSVALGRRASRGRIASTTAVFLLAGTACVSVGCLSRDVATSPPTVKTDFGISVQQTAVDKVDILFMIDNSTSMGDKQFLLQQAVPLLVQRLVQPNCVDAKGVANGSHADDSGNCKIGQPEFAPVHDMHVGIVSSSIGDFGVSNGGETAANQQVCPANTAQLNTQNDHAHLLNRDPAGVGAATDGVATADAQPNSYLSWFPSEGNAGKTPPAHPIADIAKFKQDFTALVGGVHQFGCGLEAQLESWYQFLIQPDPWVTIQVTDMNAARVGIDTTTLKQRHDFLRPDSLVAVIGLSDEDDSTVDPGAFSGRSWLYERPSPSYVASPACAKDPNDSACTSCGLSPTPAGCDPNALFYSAAQDPLNVRFQHMKQRFGVDPQYPISRYTNGLTTTTVPDRKHEFHKSNLYAPSPNCTNPLYAASLPTGSDLSSTAATNASDADIAKLCTLPQGSRSSQLVFFGFIGGVPWQLLTTDPAKATATNGTSVAFKDSLTDSDWQSIIGKDPEHYDYSGQSPYMVASTTARTGVAAGNPYNGGDYDTKGTDLEYACTFTLPKHDDGTVGTDCSANATMKDMAGQPPYDGLLSQICDCNPAAAGASAGPLCDTTTPTLQVRGKAYPTTREFSLVHDMGKNGIIASLCPRSLDQMSADYGYNPAVDAIISRLKTQLGNQCLPRKLQTESDGTVPCQILELLPAGQTCDTSGLTSATGTVLATFRKQQAADLAQEQDGGNSGVLQQDVCVVPQLLGSDLVNGSCTGSSKAGFCYVTAAQDSSLGACGQAIKFSASGLVSGAQVNLECLETSGGTTDTTTTGDDDGGSTSTAATNDN